MILPLQFLVRRVPLILLVAAAPALPSGCMTPEYHMPQGFSSTYHRALFASPAIEPAPRPDLASAINGPPGVFYPADVNYRLAERMADDGPARPFAPLAATSKRPSRR